MKSERRHELQQNSLIQSLHDLPALVRQHGSRLAVVMIAAALILVWIRIRINTSAERLDQARVSLGEAMISLNQLQGVAFAPPGQEAAAAEQRSVWYTDGLHRADDALDKAGDADAAVRAQALLYKGDLNFSLADMPDLPGAATQPSLRPELSRLELLSNAQAAYSRVLADYPNDPYAASAARFGLAAVAEDLAAGAGAAPDPSQWDVARQLYQAVVDDPNAAQAYKVYAGSRIDLIPQLQQPPAIDVPPPGTTRPTTSATTR